MKNNYVIALTDVRGNIEAIKVFSEPNPTVDQNRFRARTLYGPAHFDECTHAALLLRRNLLGLTLTR